jgi:polyisoprenyl-phosphate glycosyltransferase
MKKIILLMPVYNDWESLIKLLEEINSIIKNIEDYEFKCIVVNDCSLAKKPKIVKPKNFNSLKIINMKENKGHARCNAFGLRHINSNETYDYAIIMDSDGEDRPIEIKDLINKITEKPETSVVAKRVKRSEGLIFQTLYQIHKLITFIFTGKKVNFGNYSCLTKKDIKTLSDEASLWSSFSGSIKKNLKNLNEIDSIRDLRYFGPSKMSLFNLIIHSFSIIAVFKYTVFLRSTFMIIALSFLAKILGSITIILQILIVIFNLLIFIVSMRENQKALFKSNENILNEDEIAH